MLQKFGEFALLISQNIKHKKQKSPVILRKKIRKFDSENLSLNFYKYKYIPGVNKKSCNLAVIGE